MLGPGVLLVALALLPAGLTDRGTRRLTVAGLSLLVVSTLGTMLLQGVWASGANLVHTFAMTVWLGGLALILVALRPAERAADLAVVLPRFSRLALVAIATLIPPPP